MKRFAELRGVLARYDYTIAELATKIGRSEAYVNRRMVGKDEWELGECYRILKMFNLPAADLPRYFPEGGKHAN